MVVGIILVFDSLGSALGFAASSRHTAVETFEILRGLVQTVRMVNPQAIHFALGHQLSNQSMSCLKYLLIFHPNTGKIVGVEEPPIVDVIGSDPPIGQAEALRFDEFVQFFEACGISGVSIDRLDGSQDAGSDLRRPRTNFSEPALRRVGPS